MDAISARLGTLYSVLLGVGVLGSCLPLGSEGSTWDTGGAAAAFVVGVGLLLAWLAVVPSATGGCPRWPPVRRSWGRSWWPR